MLSALKSSGKPPADAAAVVTPLFASADIRPRETGARSRTPVLVEEEVAVVPPQLQEVVDLDVPEAGLEDQTEAALEDFKRLHRSKFPVCENLMRWNRWLSAERNLQELEVLGIRVMDSHGLKY